MDEVIQMPVKSVAVMHLKKKEAVAEIHIEVSSKYGINTKPRNHHNNGMQDQEVDLYDQNGDYDQDDM